MDSQNCLALLLMHTGKRLRTLTTADLLAFDQARLQGMFSNIGLLSLYQLLVDLEVVEDTPLAYSWNAHLKPLAIRTMLIEEGLDEPKILSVFEAYFAERQLTLAPDSVMRECRFLIRRFWKQIPETERQQSGFNLSFQTAQQLKASLRIHPRTGRQTNPKRSFHAISALYAFLNRKAAENPSQWREFAAESPISSNESRRAKLIQDVALDKMQQHTLSLLPHLTQIRRLLKENYEHAQELLTHTLQSEGGEVFQVGGVTYMKLQSEDVTRRKQAQEHLRDTIKRADSKGRGHFQIRNREEQAFWMWASVEILIRTGLRPVELFKLKRTDLINRRSATGMRVASLRIAASKTILPRIIDLSPEAFSFICRIIDRVQANHDTYPVVDRYDCVSKSFELSQPFLLQLQYSARRQAFRGREIQYSLHRFFKKMHSDGKLAEGVFLGLKDCRRIFATRLYQKNVPILAISYALGHADVKTTMHYIAYQGDDLHMHLDNLWESI
ncbi:site-specific integrase [Deinococcus sp. NW-56]|uniref:site-specific integrase n=1 Tax=Deinococcus sp. NW-56 TaxID=2080419 RepID=UPI000CF56CA9|nr:site-specific integrase [Deinococcus sp. NW-56]